MAQGSYRIKINWFLAKYWEFKGSEFIMDHGVLQDKDTRLGPH